MALLTVTLRMVKNEYKKPAPQWRDAVWNPANKKFVIKECNTAVEFDPMNVRQSMIQNIDQSVVRTCDYGTIHVIYSNEQQKTEIPWELWGRILRLYCTGKPFTVFFLASPHLREFPENGAITPYHINGGYTYPCNHDTIIIYRAEDATRVLIHELQHSCCLDHHEVGVDRVEAETEAWAELMYCALLSEGATNEFQRLLKKQSTWIQCQNARVKQFIGDSMEFPWRYTVGKEDVWRRWNILVQGKQMSLHLSLHLSLRLTCFPDVALKKKHHVSATSTIL